MKGAERARRAKAKEREAIAFKISIVETQLRNMWPDAYMMPKDMYLLHLRILTNELAALTKAVEVEIKRVEG